MLLYVPVVLATKNNCYGYVVLLSYSVVIIFSLCIINPRRACAARVTVVVLCVCVCVCVSAALICDSRN